MKICWRFHVKTPFTFWDMCREICEKFVYKHSEIKEYVKPSFQEICELHGQITREILGLRMWNIQGIVAIWTQTYRKILKSALVYL